MNKEPVANVLGELNQDYNLEAWESGEEEKDRQQYESLFGKD